MTALHARFSLTSYVAKLFTHAALAAATMSVSATRLKAAGNCISQSLHCTMLAVNTCPWATELVENDHVSATRLNQGGDCASPELIDADTSRMFMHQHMHH